MSDELLAGPSQHSPATKKGRTIMPKNQGTIYSIGWTDRDSKDVISTVIDLPDGISPQMANMPVEIVPVEEIASLRKQLTQERDSKNGAYLERNRLVAYLARRFPSGIKRTEIEGWEPEWCGCVYIDTPEGQMSWHYHDSDAHLFEGLPHYDGAWDSHTTECKYARLQALMVKHPVDHCDSLKRQFDNAIAAERERREKAEAALAFYATEWDRPDGLSAPNPRPATPTKSLLDDAGLWAAGVLTDPANAAPAQKENEKSE